MSDKAPRPSLLDNTQVDVGEAVPTNAATDATLEATVDSSDADSPSTPKAAPGSHNPGSLDQDATFEIAGSLAHSPKTSDNSDQTQLLADDVTDKQDQTEFVLSDSVQLSDRTAQLPDHSRTATDQTRYVPEDGQDPGKMHPGEGTGEWTELGSMGQAPPPGSPTMDLPGSSTNVVEELSDPAHPRARALPAGGLHKTWVRAGEPQAPLAVERLIGGYEIIQELGRGAMGVVYKARQLALNRVVALKMVLTGHLAGTKVLMRFQLEAEAVARLQHPNIVQIYEVGEQDGCPFFALEFVDGGTLSDRIEGTPLAPREAAWVVQQLAQAMDYAHRCGVVHRDLKPANILLAVNEHTPTTTRPSLLGSVPKVTDFGLAKRLEDASHTQAGSILGTPSYMAPEQAEGRNDLVGPPADIYALGAILYDLLTGRPPFRGQTILETLQQVKKLEPVPPRRLCPGLSRDLDTICLKCLEKLPGKRYGSAQDLAEDLRHFLAGEPILARRTPLWERAWKYCKRKPAMAGIVGLSCLTLVGLGVAGYVLANAESRRAQQEISLRREADEQRDFAEERFKDAQSAVDEMLTRIGQERLEYEPRMEKVRRDLLERALSFYNRFLEERRDDPDIQWQTGLSFRKVGDIRRFLGEQNKAEKAYEAAHRLFGTLADTYPEEQKYRQDLAATFNNLGNLFDETGRKMDAEKAYGEARVLQQQLLDENPDPSKVPKYREELARSCYHLALVKKKQGQAEPALSFFRQALDLQEELHKGDAASLFYRRQLARTLNGQSELFREMGREADAEASLRAALILLKKLAPDGNGIPEDRKSLEMAHDRLGALLQAANAKQAELECRAAVRLGKDLTTDFPTVPEYRQELAANYNNLGITLLGQGQREEADLALQKGLALWEKLASDFPRQPDFRRDLANSHISHGILMQTSNRLAESEADYRRAAQLLGELVKELPLVPDYQQQWGKTLVNLATVLQLTQRFKEAEKVYREALIRCRDLAERYTREPAYQYEWARTEFLLATLRQLMTGEQPQVRLDEAEKLHRAAAAKLKALAEAYPREPDYGHGLASCLNNLGDLLRATNRPDEGLRVWDEAIQVLDPLTRDYPRRPVYAQEQARLLHNVGVVLSTQKKLPEAEKAHRNALSKREKLVKDYPGEPAYRLELASSHSELAIVLARRNKLMPAVESFEKAIAVIQESGQELADRPDFLQAELVHQSNLVRLLKVIGSEQETKKCQQRIDAINQKLKMGRKP
jgi:eukaryotic-like serine/threonine-protein kinase